MDKPFRYDRGICEAPNCERSRDYKQYCIMHQKRDKKGKDLSTPVKGIPRECVVPGCMKRIKAQDLCPTHYSRLLNGIDLYQPIQAKGARQTDTCLVSNCDKKHSAKGMCQKHTVQRIQYNLTLEQIDFLARQPCMICGGEGGHLDHDHECCPIGNPKKCGRCVRGNLCGKCNRALGMMDDDPERLRKAMRYLQTWTENPSFEREIE